VQIKSNFLSIKEVAEEDTLVLALIFCKKVKKKEMKGGGPFLFALRDFQTCRFRFASQKYAFAA